MKTRIFTSLAIALLLMATLVVPAVATESIETATVTVTTYTSATVTDNGDNGLSFGSLNPGTTKQAEAASPSMTITAPIENNDDVAVSIKGTNFTGVTYTLTIDNAFWHTSDVPASATAMSTANASVTTLTPNSSVDIYHWLSIPAGQEADVYESTFTYTTVAAP